ncbi:MAG: hypothetical protein GXO29_02255 [Thermotogae bacterium]|nr:hypothetical protein [Thermotogota bacterium]
MVTSILTALLFFVPQFETFQTYLLYISIVISGFAMLIGMDSLILFHMRRVQRGEQTFYSATLLLAFFITVAWGILDWVRFGSPFDPKASFLWLFRNVFLPLDATMFSILAFYIASAAYRAFRARNTNSFLLLVSASVVMIGRVLYAHILFPIFLGVFLLLMALWLWKTSARLYGGEKAVRLALAGIMVAGALVLVIPPVFSKVGGIIYDLTDWILNVPQNAAKRGMMLGLTFGSVAFALRIMFGIERSWTR